MLQQSILCHTGVACLARYVSCTISASGSMVHAVIMHCVQVFKEVNKKANTADGLSREDFGFAVSKSPDFAR